MEDFIIAVYCCVDDLLQEIIQEYPPRKRGLASSLTDAEVITMEIVGEFQGIDTDKGIWEYFYRHWLACRMGFFSCHHRLTCQTSALG